MANADTRENDFVRTKRTFKSAKSAKSTLDFWKSTMTENNELTRKDTTKKCILPVINRSTNEKVRNNRVIFIPEQQKDFYHKTTKIRHKA